MDDDFGDFAPVQNSSTMGGFVGERNPIFATVSSISTPSHLSLYARVHKLLKPYIHSLLSAPHSILSSLFPSPPGAEPIPLLVQSRTLHLLLLWLSPSIQPLYDWESLHASLRSAVDRYEASLLGTFDAADSRSDEKGMREAAEASWEVWDGKGEWEMGRVWAEKREIFYEAGRWKPMDNFTCVRLLFLSESHVLFRVLQSERKISL
jgi:recyclin-1